MGERMYSVDQVADLLGLHVRTVRGYVRDGRLKAVRIGKQYRIAHEDLEELTGRAVAGPARETARRERHAEVSAIVQVDAVDPAAMTRVSSTLLAARNGADDGGRVRIETVYDEERASLKIILLGGVGAVADLLRITETLLAERS